MTYKKFILAIDFDGTIAELSFPEVGEIRKDAAYYLGRLWQDGHNIIINTCRSGIHEGLAQTFLKEHGIKYDYINANMPRLIEEYGKDCRKISADIYIDDKCLMGLPDTWEEIYMMISKKSSKTK
jgi:hypothetical protein